MTRKLAIISSEFQVPSTENKFKSIKVIPVQALEPKQFCRLMLGLHSLSEDEIQEIEKSKEYITKARWLLMQVLEIKLNHVRNWGRHFDKKIPNHYRKTLWLYWQLHSKNNKQQDNDILVC